jgi:hypothetical protein
MAKPDAPELTPAQVERLTSALRIWAERHPAPDDPLLAFAGSTVVTPRGLPEEIDARTANGLAFLRMVQFGCEVEPFERILARFLG